MWSPKRLGGEVTPGDTASKYRCTYGNSYPAKSTFLVRVDSFFFPFFKSLPALAVFLDWATLVSKFRADANC